MLPKSGRGMGADVARIAQIPSNLTVYFQLGKGLEELP